jgi:hypothetical protein
MMAVWEAKIHLEGIRANWTAKLQTAKRWRKDQ